MIRPLIALALAATLVACTLSPSAREQVDRLEKERAVLVEQRDALSAEAAAASELVAETTALLKEAEAALEAAVDEAAREAAAAAVEEAAAARAAALGAAVARLEELTPAFAETTTLLEEKTAEIAEIETEDLRKQTEGAAAPFLPFVPPPFQGAATALLALLPWVASKRSRQHLGRALRELNPIDSSGMAPGAAVEAIARAFGLAHSSEDPRELLEVLRRKAEADGYVLTSTDAGPKLVLGESVPTPAEPSDAGPIV
jgi:hypothetical protein